VLNDTVKDYLVEGSYTQKGWNCLRKPARHGVVGSKVSGGVCECGGGVNGAGDGPCVLVVKGWLGLPFQFAYGPLPSFGV
jgi:hypothetical protein